MHCHINPKRVLGSIDPKIYGHFLEHFHRQVYGGVFDPSSRFADEDGFRSDVMEALRSIRVPILRWPGGCFVSAYHWKKAVGPKRTPVYDKAWRVEDPNTFGTDEYILLCRKLGCEPYICTNAGTGSPEEMSDWVEYCNLEHEGEFARWRIENGHPEPYRVKYWSIGNENYGFWEIGAKQTGEWSRFVTESAKMMHHVTPDLQLSAASLDDPDWNLKLLQHAGDHLSWLSIHQYWDALNDVYNPSSYEGAMGMTALLDEKIQKIRGTLLMLGLHDRIKIAFDEWNLRSWHHPNSLRDLDKALVREDYLPARNNNDRNATYTTADSVFAACFLNTCIRNCDLVRMANFAPAVNTTGVLFTHADGIVKRSTYYVFLLLANRMGEQAVDLWTEDAPVETIGGTQIPLLDLTAAIRTRDGALTISAANKHDCQPQELVLHPGCHEGTRAVLHCITGDSKDAYNDIGREQVSIHTQNLSMEGGILRVTLPPHSANLIEILCD